MKSAARRIGGPAGTLAAVLPGASHHSLPAAKPDRLNQELADFLG
jgi:hypothetical protein